MYYFSIKHFIMSEILDLIQSEVEAPQETQNTEQSSASAEPQVEEVSAEPQVEEVSAEQLEQPQVRFNLNEKISELNSYLNKYPDRDITDYLQLKRNSDELDSNELIKKYFSEKEKMSDKAVSLEMKKFENLVDDFDEDFSDLDEDERLRLEVDYETLLGKAREWREAEISEQLKDLEQFSNANPMQSAEDYSRAFEEAREKAKLNYTEAIYAELPNIKSQSVSVNGEQVDYVPDEAYLTRMRTVSENPDTLYADYQNEDGSIKNAREWMDMLSWADKTMREQKISFIVEQAILRDRELQSRQRRNVNGQADAGIPNRGDIEEQVLDFLNERSKTKF